MVINFILLDLFEENPIKTSRKCLLIPYLLLDYVLCIYITTFLFLFKRKYSLSSLNYSEKNILLVRRENVRLTVPRPFHLLTGLSWTLDVLISDISLGTWEMIFYLPPSPSLQIN